MNPPYKNFVRKIIHQRKDKDMDKQVIVRDIKREVGNWPCQSDIARYLGKSADVAERLMSKRRSN